MEDQTQGNQTDRTASRDLPALLWLGAPAFSLAVVWLSPLGLGYQRWAKWIYREMGFIENGTAAFLVAAGVMSAMVLRRREGLPRSMRALVVLAGLFSLFLAGEETSWGQHWFHFQTPLELPKINRQGEFNLHNIEGFWQEGLTETGRRLMGKFVLIGGVILPLLLLARPGPSTDSRGIADRLARPWRTALAAVRDPKSLWYWLIPSWRLIFISMCVVLAKAPADVINHHWAHLPRGSYVRMAFAIPAGEFKEYCFALLILLYAISLYIRLPHPSAPAAPKEPAGPHRPPPA